MVTTRTAVDHAATTQEASNYASIRVSVSEGLPITVLHIGPEYTSVATGTGATPASVLFLEIGYRRTPERYFKHEPPTAAEMENAILAVEDEVTRARNVIPNNSTLFTMDDTIQAIAHSAGVEQPVGGTMAIEAMERVFARLAAVTLGTPATSAGIPEDATFAATLLILREFMHHLQFSAITIARP